MLAAVALRLWRGPSLAVPVVLVTVAQAAVGLSIGLGSRPEVLGVLGRSLWAVALVVAVSLLVSILGGFALARWGGINPISGFLGSLPGAASGMVAMSSELGADPGVVASLMYLRVLAVAVVAPLVAAHLPAVSGGGSAVRVFVPPDLPVMSLSQAPALLVGAVLAAVLARRLSLPSPGFLGPLILGLALRWAGISLGGQIIGALPGWLSSFSLGLIGATVGGGLDRSTIATLGRAGLLHMAVIAGLLATSLGAGYAFHLATGIDLTTSLLGAVPGAMDAITAAAYDLGADGAVVAAMHLVRFLVMAFTGPWLAVRLVGRVEGRERLHRVEGQVRRW